MPANVEVICSVGDVLTLTAQEAVACGLCDGIADSLEQVLQQENVPSGTHPKILADPFKQSNKQMEGIIKMFLTSMAAVGGSIHADSHSAVPGHRRLYFSHAGVGDARTLAEYRKIKALIDRYPDLVTSSETRAEVDGAVRSLETHIQRQKAADKQANETERKNRAPRPTTLGW